MNYILPKNREELLMLGFPGLYNVVIAKDKNSYVNIVTFRIWPQLGLNNKYWYEL